MRYVTQTVTGMIGNMHMVRSGTLATPLLARYDRNDASRRWAEQVAGGGPDVVVDR